MKVVCINDIFNGEKSAVLTKGIVYEANPVDSHISNNTDVYLITITGTNITDDSVSVSKPYYKCRFIPIEEYREIKLNNILE